jgi:hypothetical protein
MQAIEISAALVLGLLPGAVADSVAAAEADSGAAVAAGVAAADDGEMSIRRHEMFGNNYKISLLTGVVSLAVLSAPAGFAIAEEARSAVSQLTYMTPEDGFHALVSAVQANDKVALREILGPASDDLLSSGDPVDDQNARERFLTAYQAKSQITRMGINVATLNIGMDSWDFPIPLTKTGNAWRFDTESGREELINRRVGRNELNAIQACLAFVDAQRDYASGDHSGDGVLQYAQRFISTPGKEDGLYWPKSDGKAESPLGDLFAQASVSGYQVASASENTSSEKSVLYGYKYQILTSQGPAARGGSYDYVIGGKMIGGFAMIAYPAEYGVAGVMTFMVNHDGEVYQKDLGPETEVLAPAIRRFNPDRTWKRT